MHETETADDMQAYVAEMMAQGRPSEAAKFLRRRIESGRGGLLARILFVRVLAASGETNFALQIAQETSRTHPDTAAAASLLGEALLTFGVPAAAIGEFQRALRLDPDLLEARYQLGIAWATVGEPEKALEAFGAMPADAFPALPTWIKEVEALKAQPRSAPGYVRHLFDQFSAEYDSRMRGQLSYRAPEILRELADMTMPGRKGLMVLDLGCGTGLSGAAFKDMAARLDGIDLSPQMVIKARAKNIYANLLVADIELSLPAEGPRFDLILAADTLVYLGDLERVFAGVSQKLNDGGFFLFTVEAKDGEGFELGPKRRWRHSDPYLRALAAKNGFTIAGMLQCEPRTEAGEPVAGFAVALSKP